MGGKDFDRRHLFKLAGAAAAGGVALGTGLGVAPAPASAQTFGAGFVPITPYRSFDSRPERLLTNEAVDLDVVTDENLNLRIPETALAVSYNLTIADTTGQGFLAMLPAGEDWAGNSSINWWASNLLLANGGVVALGFSDVIELPGSVTILCGGGGTTAFIVDVTGYFV